MKKMPPLRFLVLIRLFFLYFSAFPPEPPHPPLPVFSIALSNSIEPRWGHDGFVIMLNNITPVTTTSVIATTIQEVIDDIFLLPNTHAAITEYYNGYNNVACCNNFIDVLVMQWCDLCHRCHVQIKGKTHHPSFTCALGWADKTTASWR